MFNHTTRSLRNLFVLFVLALLLLVPATTALAAPNPSGTGQPSADCADFSSSPGQSASAPGSAFNPNGVAGTVYAGEQPQNSINPQSVSQYDIACLQVSQH
jgi:hypothetical protein